jgi:hypothetical protein
MGDLTPCMVSQYGNEHGHRLRHGSRRNATIYQRNFDFKKVSGSDMLYGYLVTMPFRFRVASPYHCNFEYRNAQYDIWITNQPIPTGESGVVLHEVFKSGLSLDDLWSRVLIIPHACRPTTSEIDALKEYEGGADDVPFESRKKQLFPAMQALNGFIVGYHTATGELFGGHALQLLTVLDYMDRVTLEIAFVGIPLAHWTRDNINELFDLKAEPLQPMTSLATELTDLPDEKLVGIPDAISRLNDFYFYELAFEARARMTSADYVGGLLLAVAALEGAHSVYVGFALDLRLPPSRTGDDKKLDEKFTKELGFSLCNKLTPYLFMDARDRPTDDVIQKAAIAVTYRNEIMHALRSARGQYRIRTRTNAELTDACDATLKLYDLYRSAVERFLERHQDSDSG